MTTPTHFVRADGNDNNSGTSPQNAWATIARARAALWNVEAAVQVGSGHFVGEEVPSGAAGRYNIPIQWLTEYPYEEYRERPDRWTYIEGGARCGPASNGVVPGAPWQQVTLNGYPVWRWAGLGTAPRYSLGYGPTRTATPERATHWKRDGLLLATPEGWAQLVATNRTQRHGYYQAADGTIYLYAPHAGNPNNLWWSAGTGAGFSFSTPDSVVDGFVIRGFDNGVQPGAYADRCLVQRCRIETSNNGVKGYASYTPTQQYPKGAKILHNTFVNTGLWSRDQTAFPSAVWSMLKSKIKVDPSVHPGYPNNRYPTDRIAGALEGMAVYVTAFADAEVGYNTIEGYCNGVGSAPHPSFDLGASRNIDVHDCTLRQIMDDAFEFEQQAIDVWIRRCHVEGSPVFMSNGPTNRGPVYALLNTAILGTGGLAVDLDGSVDGVAGLVFKYSNNSSPPAHIYGIGNTFADDGQSVVLGGAQYASYSGGSGTPEVYHLYNNLFILTHDAWQYRPGHLDEHHNQWATSDPTRGFKNLATGVLHTDYATYQAETWQGLGSNPIDLHDVAAVRALVDDKLRLTLEGMTKLPGAVLPGVPGGVPPIGSPA